MKRLLALPFLLLFALIASTTFAQGPIQHDEVVTLKADQVVNSDYFAAGEKVEISGTVNGDVYVAGGQVLIDGTINGDLLAAGGTIIMSGKVSEDARIAGGQVTIPGSIGRNLTITAGNVDITNSATISGNLVSGVGNITIGAPIQGNIVAGAGNMLLANTVSGNIDAGIGTMRLTSKAQVNGTLNYWSEEPGSIDKSASIAGTVNFHQTQDSEESEEKARGILSGISFVSTLASFITTLVLGWLLLHFFPNGVRTISDTLRNHPWKTLGIGIAAFLIIPIIAVLLLITILGIPLGLLLLGVYIVLVYISRIFVIFWFGSYISRRIDRKSSDLWILVIGAIVYYLIGFIPLIGGITEIIATLIGFGALIFTVRTMRTNSSSKN